jgi:hypothetical protein
LGTFTVGTNPIGVAFDGTNVWVAIHGGSVAQLRASDGAFLGTFPLPFGSFGVAFDGINVWVTSPDSGIVSKL